MKNSVWGITLIQGFILIVCDSPIAMKDELLSVLEAFSLLFQKWPQLSILERCSFYHFSIVGVNVLPKGPLFMLI